MQSIAQFLAHRPGFSLYAAVLALIAVGLVGITGTAHLGAYACYIVALFAAYGLAERFLTQYCLPRITVGIMPARWIDPCLTFICLLSLIFMVVHAHLLHWPFWQTLQHPGPLEHATLRQALNVPFSLSSYLSSTVARAIAPFLMFLLYQRQRYALLLLVMAVGGVYTLNLLQKSLVVLSFLSLLVFCLTRGRTLHALLVGLYMGLLLWCLIYVSNAKGDTAAPPVVATQALRNAFLSPGSLVEAPVIKTATPQRRAESQEIWQHFNQRDKADLVRFMPSSIQRVEKVLGGISDTTQWPSVVILLVDRIFIVPGYVVGIWFDLVPSAIPYTGGCNYRFLAPLLHCDFINLPNSIWQRMNQGYVDYGLAGSMNVASMMENYAAFGLTGLLLEGLILGAWLALTEQLFLGRPDHYLVFNAIPLLTLSSVSLPYSLLSGGWLCSLALYVLFCRAHAASLGAKGGRCD